MHRIPLDRLPPIPVIALRTMQREPLTFAPGAGWLPGYPCPACDRRMIPFNSMTVQWLASVELVEIRGNTARLTVNGHGALAELDGVVWAA